MCDNGFLYEFYIICKKWIDFIYEILHAILNACVNESLQVSKIQFKRAIWRCKFDKNILDFKLVFALIKQDSVSMACLLQFNALQK